MKRTSIAVLAAAGLLSPGCSDSGFTRKSGPSLAPTDFVDTTAVLIPADPPSIRPPTAAETIGPMTASGGVLDVMATPGRPGDSAAAAGGAGAPPLSATAPAANRATATLASSAAAQSPVPVGRPAMVDTKVGDINGKPVYANTFFASFEDRLRAEAALTTRDKWRISTARQIAEKLDKMIEGELLRAEALENFTPEQKQGFFAWMKGLQERVESQSQGSREAANERLEQTKGKSLDEYMRDEEQQQLVEFQVREKIQKRISVPWRDIKIEYERYYEALLNPPPKAMYRLVQIPTNKPEDIAEFTRLRERGTPFAEIAANKTLNRYKPETGGLEEREFKGERKDAEFFRDEKLNGAARTMQVGEVAGPFPIGDNQAYLGLDVIQQTTRTLYEAQVAIEMQMRERRIHQAQSKYVNRLRERASISSTPEMTRQLLVIADARYWPAGKK